MSHELLKHQPKPDDQIVALEKEIAFLEMELGKVEAEVNAFTAQIRSRLHFQILRIHELTSLYKKQKAAKKAKRLEQKKKGKNYREPQALKRTDTNIAGSNKLNITNKEELKRLYKEAIRHVHPDKFVNEEADKSERATALTVQLNDLYESGDLDELKGFHEHILSGNAMSHIPYKPSTITDTNAMLNFLRKKREELANALQQTTQSELYTVLTTYPDPLSFIGELDLQFNQKITQLEKRTRIKKG